MHPTKVAHLTVVPSHILLSNTDVELTTAIDHREERLKRQLASGASQYDYMVIDCPPALSWLTINAFTAADQVLVMVSPGYFELDSIVQTSKTIREAYKATRRVLEDRGFLGLVSPGWTSALHAGALDDRTARSAVFVLTVPRRTRLPGVGGRRRVNRPPAGSRSDLAQPPRAREAPAADSGDTDGGTGANDRHSHRGEPTNAATLGTLPATRTEALGVTRALRERAAVLRRLSAEYLRHLYRPFWRAGWLPRDFLHALDHDPRGRQHGYTAEARAPAGWVRSRLAAWLGRDGTPLPSRSQCLAEDRRRIRAEQDARRAQQAAARKQTADYRAAAARAREMLTEALARTSAGRAIPSAVPSG